MSEPDVSSLLTVSQAIAILDAVAVTPRTLRMPLAEAGGLVLAEDLAADRDYPPFDKSLMDGFAVRCADVAAAPATLKLIGEVAAGQVADRPISPGEAMAIMTGAPLPVGADGVVPVEETSRDSEHVRITRALDASRYISRQGADITAGATILQRGTRLAAAQIAAAAMVGAAQVTVYDRPRAAVLSTGDELVGVGDTPVGAQIRNSNSPMLLALLRQLGCDTIDLGAVRDDPAAIAAKLEQGLAHDVLFVSGGMSMGTYDHVPRLLAELGVNLRITKLRIKPGKPFVFGERNGRFVFGLPGNPVSGFVCTIRLAARLLARLSGGTPTENWITGQLTTALPANGPREFYQPCRITRTPTATRITPLNWKGSADLFTLASAQALLVRPENDPPRSQGETVTALELPR